MVVMAEPLYAEVKAPPPQTQPQTLPEPRRADPDAPLDAIVVGAGPLGLEACAALGRAGFRYVCLEAGAVAQQILSWPPGCRFRSSPERVAVAGVPIHTPSQEPLRGDTYVSYCRMVAEMLHLDVRTHEPVVDASKTDGGFTLVTDGPLGRKTYKTTRVVLATGFLSRPLVPPVPGVDLPHVHRQPRDPHVYYGRRVMIVGGGNTAVETAIRCFHAGADVALCLLEDGTDRGVKASVDAELNLLDEKYQVRVYKKFQLTAIEVGRVRLALVDAPDAEPDWFDADFVVLCTGYEPDRSLFRQLGVTVDEKTLAPKFDEQTMQTDARGVYVVGTATLGKDSADRVLIATCREHVRKLLEGMAGGDGASAAEGVGDLSKRSYEVTPEDVDKGA